MANSKCWECAKSGDDKKCIWVNSGGRRIYAGTKYEAKAASCCNASQPWIITITSCPMFEKDKKINQKLRRQKYWVVKLDDRGNEVGRYLGFEAAAKSLIPKGTGYAISIACMRKNNCYRKFWWKKETRPNPKSKK